MITAELAALCEQAAEHAFGAAMPGPGPVIARARDPRHGDYATNWSLHLAGPLGRPAPVVAAAIARAMPPHPAVAQVAPAGPGFLNVRLSDAWLLEQLARLLLEGPVVFDDVTPIKNALGPVDTWPEPVSAVDETYDHPSFLVRHTLVWLESLERLALQEGLVEPGPWEGRAGLDPTEPLTRSLLLGILAYADEIDKAVRRAEPERLPAYAETLCREFHRYYARHRVFGQAPFIGRARAGMIQGTLLVLHLVMIDILGIRPLQNS
jgi:arginyl-tRNA synthetase